MMYYKILRAAVILTVFINSPAYCFSAPVQGNLKSNNDGKSESKSEAPNETRINDLSSFLDLLKRNSLELAAYNKEVGASEKRTQGWNIPPAMVGLMSMKDESGSAIGFEISQSVLLPQKLNADSERRRLEFELTKQQSLISEHLVFAEGRNLFYRLGIGERKLNLLKEKKIAIENHLKLARASSRSDSLLKLHLLAVENDLESNQVEAIGVETNLEETRARIAALLNLDSEGLQILIKDDLMALDESEFKKLMAKSDVALALKALEMEKLAVKEKESKLNFWPDLNLRFRESGGTSMTPKFSELMIGVSLPLAGARQVSGDAESASHLRQKAEIEFSNLRRKLQTQRALLQRKLTNLVRQQQILLGSLLPRAERRAHLVHSISLRDMAALQDHRESLEAPIDIKLKVLDYRQNFEDSIFELRKVEAGVGL